MVKTDLPGLMLLEPQVYTDERGFFLETYQERGFSALGIRERFVLDGHSMSTQGVLRGMHFQIRKPQAKTVYVSSGEIFDAVVDLRRGSPTHGRWYGATLNSARPTILYIPPGFAHGFCVLSPTASVHYKLSEFYDPNDEGGLLWSDPQIGIEWPIKSPSLKQRDADFPCLAALNPEQLPRHRFTDINS